MESLPQEIIEFIAQYLSARDLSRCCSVSVTWRNMFGSDRLWRPHCDRQLTNYLMKTERVLKTDFLDFETGDLSDWRLNFMREACLRNNYVKCNYKVRCYPYMKENFVPLKMFYKNEYILKLKYDRLEVWNVKESPILYLSLPFELNPNFPFKVFEITETDKIVLVQAPIVRVFSLCLTSKSLELNHLFSFLEPRKCQDNSAESLRALICGAWRGEHLMCGIGWCEVLKNILIAVFIIRGHFTLHIWNVETGHKLKEDVWPFDLIQPTKTHFKCCKKTMNVIINVEDSIDPTHVIDYYSVYSLNRLEYLPFYVSFKLYNVFRKCISKNKFIIFDKFCAVISCNNLYVYNYLTRKLLYTTFADGSLCSVQNNVVFEREGHVWIFEPSSKTIVAEIDSLLGHLITVINDFSIFIYECSREARVSFIPLKVNNDLSIPLFRFCSIENILINNAGSKVILFEFEDLIVIHFW